MLYIFLGERAAWIYNEFFMSGTLPVRAPVDGHSVNSGRELRSRIRWSIWERVLHLRDIPLLRRSSYWLLLWLGCDIPLSVRIGERLRLPHGLGVVIHNRAQIGDRVAIFSGVTVGRADCYRKTHTKFEGIRLEDDVVLCTGSKILCDEGVLTVARGTVVGANAVLLNSTKPFEVWAGIPARCIGMREMEGVSIGEFLG